MKKTPKTFKQFLIWQLRMISYKWPARGQAMKAARIDRGRYRCAICKGVFPNKEISLDHREPVVDPKKGWQGFEVYLARLFCPVENWQVLCDGCHDKKTAKEKKIRAKYKKLLKEVA